MPAEDRIALYALIGDIKQNIGKSLLVMAALIALLQDKRIIATHELHGKIAALDRMTGGSTA
ncbi:MAG TPA: hypothetical protein DCM14_01595 [Clostridiales bacterium UBA8153]|nr:hypothetical protein [Clostridiales bacterium UBA8153]